MPVDSIEVNRAPVLTLWAAVVAERLGYDRDEALSLGKAVSGLTAQAKGRNLGIFQERTTDSGRPAPRAVLGEEFFIRMLGRNIPVKKTETGIRSMNKDKPVDAASVQRYLEKAFGDALADVTVAMRSLAGAREAARLNEEAFGLYEKFRPSVPQGQAGWGKKGTLSLGSIRDLR